MCIDSQTDRSMFTDASFCFVDSTLRRFACWCPISECVPRIDGNGYRCEFTTFTLVGAMLLTLAALGVGWVYVRASSDLYDLQFLEHKNAVEHHKYRDVLFGVYHASSGSGDVASGAGANSSSATELSSLKPTGASATSYGTGTLPPTAAVASPKEQKTG